MIGDVEREIECVCMTDDIKMVDGTTATYYCS